MIEGLPQFLFYYLWALIILNFIGIYEIFVTKERVYSIRHRQLRGLMGLILGFVLLVFMMGWVQ